MTVQVIDFSAEDREEYDLDSLKIDPIIRRGRVQTCQTPGGGRSTAAPPPPLTPGATSPSPKICISGKSASCSLRLCNFQETGGWLGVTSGALKMERREGQYRQAEYYLLYTSTVVGGWEGLL